MPYYRGVIENQGYYEDNKKDELARLFKKYQWYRIPVFTDYTKKILVWDALAYISVASTDKKKINDVMIFSDGAILVNGVSFVYGSKENGKKLYLEVMEYLDENKGEFKYELEKLK